MISYEEQSLNILRKKIIAGASRSNPLHRFELLPSLASHVSARREGDWGLARLIRPPEEATAC